MFPLADSTRRMLCIAAFVTLGVLPVLLTSGWCGWRHREARIDEAAAELGRQLDVTATLNDVQYVRPGFTRYQGLTLCDPETGRLLLRADTIDARWGRADDWQRQAVDSLELTPSRVEITAEGWQELGRVTQRALSARGISTEPYLRLSLAAAVFRHPSGDLKLAEVQGWLRGVAGGVQADLNFRLPGSAASQPLRMALARNRQTTPPLWSFLLQTSGNEIPCRLLAALVPDFPTIAALSRFAGQIDMVQGVDGWQTEVRGEIAGFDLNELGREGIPHLLGGAARLAIAARFRQGRMEEAAGVLSASRGMLGRSLIAAATQNLGLAPMAQRPGLTQSNRELVPYEELAIAFLINAQGLRLEGRCPASGAMLADRSGPLLTQTAPQPLPLAALIRTLCSDGGAGASDNRLSERLSRVLPLR